MSSATGSATGTGDLTLVDDAPEIVAPEAVGPPGGQPGPGFRGDIEGLRGVAVMLVALAHAGLAFEGGYVGVDVFFVISGFLITGLLHAELQRRGRISLGRFYARRARRILPAAAVVILATVGAAYLWLSPLRLHRLLQDALWATLSGANFAFAAQGTDYFASTAEPSLFQHTWSLGVEEQFYLVWPLLLGLLYARGARRGSGRAAVLWGLLALIAVSFGLSVATTTTQPAWAYFGPHVRAWELALGGLVAVVTPWLARMRPALACQMSWTGLVLVVASALLLDDRTSYPGSAVAYPVLGAALIVAGGVPGHRRSARLVLDGPVPRWLGRISYSLYLWHWPLLLLAPHVAGRALTRPERAGAILVAIALSTVTYLLVERPLRTSRWLRASAPRSLVGAALLLGLVVAGLAGVNRVNDRSIDVAGDAPVPAADAGTVVNLVEEAAAATAMPSVTVPLARVSEDKPGAPCFLGWTATVPPTTPNCVLGDPAGAQTVVLFGDSHANQWLAALDALARERHWRLLEFAKAGCSPADYPALVSVALHRVYTECDLFRANVVQVVNRIRPSVVILGSEMRTIAVTPDGITKTVSGLRASGARVVYLADTPYPGRDVPECLSEHPDAVGACATRRHDYRARLDGFAQRRIEVAGARNAGASVLDTTPWFCTDEVCPAVINHIVVYMDDSHITNSYARWLAPEFGSALDRLLAVPAGPRKLPVPSLVPSPSPSRSPASSVPATSPARLR